MLSRHIITGNSNQRLNPNRNLRSTERSVVPERRRRGGGQEGWRAGVTVIGVC